ncbi:MAG: cytochrome C [Bacteroidota bacterium]
MFVKIALPNVGDAPTLKVDTRPEIVQRGDYLANHVCVCIDCHSKRDWTRFSGPPIAGTFGMGGEIFDQKYGFPGAYYSKNITPSGISRYTDGELLRVITTGVTKEGNALFPVMPFHYYGQMDEEDIKAIIAYIRTLKPIINDVPNSHSDFPMNFIINTIPHKATFNKRPISTDKVAYGKYLASAGACVECHTKFENGKLVDGTEYGGGREFPFPDGSLVRSGNITPDNSTGIGGWSCQQFIGLFRQRSDSVTLSNRLLPGDFNTIMPWTMYGQMTDEDLSAIYQFLKTIKPINNKVEKFVATK